MFRPLHLLLLLSMNKCIKCELYSALSALEPLLETHVKISATFDSYLRDEKKRIGILKYHLERFQKEHRIAMRNVSHYLGNPLNGFTLIKRLTVDLEFIEKKIKERTVYRRSKISVYPSSEDMLGTAIGLARLHYVYKLNVTALSNGELSGTFKAPMSTSDCFELGRALYGAQEFQTGLQWMMEAHNKYRADDEPFTRADITEHIAYGHIATNNTATALEWAQKTLALLSSDSPRYEYNKRMLKHLEDQEKQQLGKSKANATETTGHVSEEIQLFESACRGETEIPANIVKRLRCRYLRGRHQMLKIAPIKVEQVFYRPHIYLLYNVTSLHHLEQIKKLAKSKLSPAKNLKSNRNNSLGTRPRLCQVATLNDEETMKRLSRRVFHFSGLDVEYAEPYEVVNYGVAGYHQPHYDFIKKSDERLKSKNGNRLATVLFYLSDVALGGATVFPELSLSVYPVKGAALFWYNLDRSGKPDTRTKHAGCPVLTGDKWVSNKWIYQRGQELRRPCPKLAHKL